MPRGLARDPLPHRHPADGGQILVEQTGRDRRPEDRPNATCPVRVVDMELAARYRRGQAGARGDRESSSMPSSRKSTSASEKITAITVGPVS